MNEIPSVIWKRINGVNNSSVLILKPNVFDFVFLFFLSFRVVTLFEGQMANTRVFFFLLFLLLLFCFFVNSQARLKAGARGRIKLKAIMAQTRGTLHHGVAGKEAGIL